MRTAGSQALALSGSYLAIQGVEVLASGEYAIAIGRDGATDHLTILGCRVRGSYADGINLYAVTTGVVGDCTVDGADDDLLAIGDCSDIAVSGFMGKASTTTLLGVGAAVFSRSGTTATITAPGSDFTTNDLTGQSITVSGSVAPFNGSYTVATWSPSTITYTVAGSGSTGSTGHVLFTSVYTTWGRGISILGTSSDIVVSGFNIDTVKQSGIYLADGQPRRILISNGHIRNCGVSSAYGLEVVNCQDASVDSVVFEDMASSDCVYLWDWDNLIFKNCRMTQRRDQYCRGIHVHESAIGGSTRNRLDISNCSIQMIGASTSQPIYLVPDPASPMSRVFVTGNNLEWPAPYASITTDYIATGKICNNSFITGAGAYDVGHSTGLISVNNN
jgi:hypothetical protein